MYMIYKWIMNGSRTCREVHITENLLENNIFLLFIYLFCSNGQIFIVIFVITHIKCICLLLWRLLHNPMPWPSISSNLWLFVIYPSSYRMAFCIHPSQSARGHKENTHKHAFYTQHTCLFVSYILAYWLRDKGQLWPDSDWGNGGWSSLADTAFLHVCVDADILHW